MEKNKKKAIVAMSGGVDSSVAAKLIKDQGYETMGIFLHFWKEPGSEMAENKCCSTMAFMDARRVCLKAGIKLYTMNFSREFKKDIVDDFLSEYDIGNTPNPCVRCNKLVKIGLLIKRAKKLGYDYVATGHYVRIKEQRTKNKEQKIVYKLYKAKDKQKDQSYFLWSLTQAQLKHLLFPLGDYKKTEVRVMAEKFNLPVAEKSESQEVCFIPEKSHNDFLKRHLKLKSGPIKLINTTFIKGGEGDFKKIGEHQGLPLYTIGQRRGVEIGGTGPYYVAKMDKKNNVLYVVSDANDPVLFKDKLEAKNINWIAGTEPKFPLKCEAVIRYRHEPVKCVVTTLIGRGIYKSPLYAKGVGGILVRFSKPQRAITSGQSVVFYKGDELIGGGIIK